MAELKVYFDDAQNDRIINGICGQYRRPDKVFVNGIESDNSTSKQDFANNILCTFIKEIVSAFEANEAAESARKIALQKTINEISITPLKTASNVV